MIPSQSRTACENALKDHKAYNEHRHIFPSHTPIINRLIERHLELKDAWEEVYVKVNHDPDALWVFFDGLLNITAQWNPKKLAQSRSDRAELIEVNRKIVKAAEHLAQLLDERNELNTHSGFYSDTENHICRIIEMAAKNDYAFERFVRGPLGNLRAQYGSKYWPTINACIRAIAADAKDPQIEASNPTTAAATTGKRPAEADYLKALDERIKEECRSDGNGFPSTFALTDKSMAAIATCALNRDPDRPFGAEFVKNWRQRERKAASAKRSKAPR